MADLLALVPAIRVKLYVAAPSERRDEVLRQMARPTFQKIGLSDYCRYIPIEALHTLTSRLEGLGGYIQPNVIDSIAVEPESEIGAAK